MEREAIYFILWPKFVLFIFSALISLPLGKRLKAEVVREVGNFGVYCCKPSKLYVHTASYLVDGLLYSDRLKAVLRAQIPSVYGPTTKSFGRKKKRKSIAFHNVTSDN